MHTGTWMKDRNTLFNWEVSHKHTVSGKKGQQKKYIFTNS